MAEITPSFIIASGGHAGSIQYTAQAGDVPYYVVNIQNARIKGTGNGGTEATVVLILADKEKIIFPLAQIATIGGAAPVSLTDAVNKLAALIVE